MPQPNNVFKISHFSRLAFVFGLAGLCAGCFQPLYGSSSPVNGVAVKDQLAAVDVQPIDAPNGTPIARVGVGVRNDLIFDLGGGQGKPTAPTHSLTISMTGSRQNVIVDSTTARAELENYGIDAIYSLTDIATKRIVLKGRTFARVSYDIPGQQQRFAAARGLRDAEDRAAKVIADQIKQRLASHFLAGT
jgi:LPS-assembly lipoprotein